MPYIASATHAEHEIILALVHRAQAINSDINGLTLYMDLENCHRDIPLRLADMLAGNVADFAHDIGGIMRHMNRNTGKIEGCFTPRFAVRQ